MLFIFRLEGNRGGGNNFDRVASTFSPRRGSGDDDFSFFLTRRVLFYFISLFFFLFENGRLIARIISVILARIKIGGTEF